MRKSPNTSETARSGATTAPTLCHMISLYIRLLELYSYPNLLGMERHLRD